MNTMRCMKCGFNFPNLCICDDREERLERLGHSEPPRAEDHDKDLKVLAQDMVATLERVPGYRLAITDRRILLIAKEMLRLHERSEAEREYEPHPFPPIAFVEWLQQWWKRDATWRDQQRAMFGMETAQLLRGVAEMLEQKPERSTSAQEGK